MLYAKMVMLTRQLHYYQNLKTKIFTQICAHTLLLMDYAKEEDLRMRKRFFRIFWLKATSWVSIHILLWSMGFVARDSLPRPWPCPKWRKMVALRMLQLTKLLFVLSLKRWKMIKPRIFFMKWWQEVSIARLKQGKMLSRYTLLY